MLYKSFGAVAVKEIQTFFNASKIKYVNNMLKVMKNEIFRVSSFTSSKLYFLVVEQNSSYSPIVASISLLMNFCETEDYFLWVFSSQ